MTNELAQATGQAAMAVANKMLWRTRIHQVPTHRPHHPHHLVSCTLPTTPTTSSATHSGGRFRVEFLLQHC